MRTSLFLVAVACAMGFGAMSASAQDSAIKQRQKLMKSVGDSAKVAGQMMKGVEKYDGPKAAEAMKTINSVPDKYVKLFPKGTSNKENPDTEASPKIWVDMDTFLKNAKELKAASDKAAQAATEGEAVFKPTFVALTKVCKNCHEDFRIEKEK